jgi:hypothetical protein
LEFEAPRLSAASPWKPQVWYLVSRMKTQNEDCVLWNRKWWVIYHGVFIIFLQGLHECPFERLKLPHQHQHQKHKKLRELPCIKSKYLAYSAFKFEQSFSIIMIRILYVVVTEKDLIATNSTTAPTENKLSRFFRVPKSRLFWW